jgi:two-component system LytT family response regulator
MPITVLVISEEEDTIKILKKFEEENTILMTLLGFTSSIETGVDLIKSLRPSVVFLDFELNDTYFFELLDKLEFNIPKLIFISSNISNSIKAFKYNAVDFILKPIEFNTIILSLYKSIKLIEMERIYQEQKVSTINSINLNNQTSDYVAISSLDKIELIQMKDIIFCQADGKYTNFHLVDGKKLMSSRNLGEYSTILDANYFFRIHHSSIINLRHIVKISKKDGYFCELTNKIVLPIAKRRQDDFNKFIKLKD